MSDMFSAAKQYFSGFFVSPTAGTSSLEKSTATNKPLQSDDNSAPKPATSVSGPSVPTAPSSTSYQGGSSKNKRKGKVSKKNKSKKSKSKKSKK